MWRRQDVGHGHALRRQRRSNAVDQKSGISVVIDMLELTPSALGKMPARRLGAMWTRNCRAIRLHEIAGGREGYVAAALGHPVPARCYADDVLRHKHSRSEEHTSELQSLMRISYA